MLVSKERNFLFLHVPKTGGTMAQDIFNMVIEGDKNWLSVIDSARLTRKGGNLAIDMRDEEVARMIRRQGRRSYEAWKEIPAFIEQIIGTNEEPAPLHKHAVVKQVKSFFSTPFYSNCAKVIMVRNPYSRIWSAYKYLFNTQGNIPGSWMRKGERIVTIDEFLDEDRYIRNKLAWRQVNWYDADAENFHVFQLEDFANSIRQIVRDIMKAPPERVERIEFFLQANRNVRTNASTSGPDEWKGMSPETRKRIERIYRADFEAFGY